jgi:phenylpyruvate tautomerase PptA (4-oxalocrotonate tautomerase family)
MHTVGCRILGAARSKEEYRCPTCKLPGSRPEQKRKVAERVTTVLIEDGRAKRENIHVSFHDVPSTDYAEAGVLVVDLKRTP